MRIMHSMEMDDIEKYDATTPYPVSEKADYPYGLRICLTHAEFEKLDLDPSVAVVGGMVHLHAVARITSVHATDNEGGSQCRVEMQIEDLAIDSEDEENESD